MLYPWWCVPTRRCSYDCHPSLCPLYPLWCQGVSLTITPAMLQHEPTAPLSPEPAKAWMLQHEVAVHEPDEPYAGTLIVGLWGTGRHSPHRHMSLSRKRKSRSSPRCSPAHRGLVELVMAVRVSPPS